MFYGNAKLQPVPITSVSTKTQGVQHMKEIRFPMWMPADDQGFSRVVDLSDIVASQVDIISDAGGKIVNGLFVGTATHYPASGGYIAVSLYVFLEHNSPISVARHRDLDILMDGIPVGSHCRIHTDFSNHKRKVHVSWRDVQTVARGDVVHHMDVQTWARGDVVHHMDGSDDAPD